MFWELLQIYVFKNQNVYTVLLTIYYTTDFYKETKIEYKI